MTIQFDPAAVTHRMHVLDEIGVGPLWLRRDALFGASPASAPVPGPAAARQDAAAPATAQPARKADEQAPAATAHAAAWHDDPLTGAAAVPVKTTLTLCTRSDADAAGTMRYLFIARATGMEGAEQLFDNILRALGMQKTAETQGDLHGLAAAIAAHDPSALVLMDPAAALQLTGVDGATFESLRGRIHRVGAVPALVTYAATHLLRHPADKRKAWDDLCLLMALQAADAADDVADPA
jgi:hypothetical protein